MTKSDQLIASLLENRFVSFALKRALRDATARDPVDALRDAEEMVRILQARLDEIIAQHSAR